jgi:hypothetical protein
MKKIVLGLIIMLGITSCAEIENLREVEKYGVAGVEMINGVPTPASSKQLYDAMDYYGAVQIYLWSMPAMGLKGWENAGVDMGSNPALDGQISLYQGYDGAAGILTPNTEVTYLISFVDTNIYGPAVWEIPAGATAGYVGDQWQRPILDTGVTGPDLGKGIKLLIVGPNNEVPEHDGSYTVVISPTNVIWLGTRNMSPLGENHDRINAEFDSYPYNNPEMAKRAKLIREGEAFKQYQPHGMEFWNNLNQIVQREVMAERDVFFYAMMKNIGIEKGKEFNPTLERIEMLIEAEKVGYEMAINNSFKKRIEGPYYKGKRWFLALINSPDQIQDTHGEMFERASWFHEAIGSTRAMKLNGPGPGQTYLGQYEDSEGKGFDGGKLYKLEVPANVPAAQFWALTIYSSDSRTLIRNNSRKAEINSLNNLIQNKDGTTTLYIGPKAPEGMESNWVETTGGQNWFTYFRFYNPEMSYFDKSWELNDIEKVNW